MNQSAGYSIVSRPSSETEFFHVRLVLGEHVERGSDQGQQNQHTQQAFHNLKVLLVDVVRPEGRRQPGHYNLN